MIRLSKILLAWIGYFGFVQTSNTIYALIFFVLILKIIAAGDMAQGFYSGSNIIFMYLSFKAGENFIACYTKCIL